MKIEVKYWGSNGRNELKRLDKGLSNKAIVLSGDIEDKCINIKGGTIKSIKENINAKFSKYNLVKSYFDTGINDEVYNRLYVAIGDYIFEYFPIKRLSVLGCDTEVVYTLVNILDAYNSDTLKLRIMTGVDDMDEWGLDQEIIDQILSECTEVKVD